MRVKYYYRLAVPLYHSLCQYYKGKIGNAVEEEIRSCLLLAFSRVATCISDESSVF